MRLNWSAERERYESGGVTCFVCGDNVPLREMTASASGLVCQSCVDYGATETTEEATP